MDHSTLLYLQLINRAIDEPVTLLYSHKTKEKSTG